VNDDPGDELELDAGAETVEKAPTDASRELPTPAGDERAAVEEQRAGDGAEQLVPGEPLRLVEKHSRAIRWMHWVNFPVLTIMIWSGLLIYWGDSVPPYQHAHQVYRIGIGSWTLVRLFPDWFWKLLNAPYQLTTGLGWHFLIMWVFAINGIAYAVYLAVSGEWRVLWPQRRSFVDAMWVTLYDMHVPAARRRGLPAQGKYNGAQKIAYSAIVLMGAGSLVTGLAIYKPTQAHWLTSALGGYEMARWFHFWLTMGFCGFFLVHVGQVVMAGWNNFRSMVSGYEIQETAPASKELREHTMEGVGD
jgi:thiosulfate reductase cytochrome b subunit